MLVTLLGISIDVQLLQPEKASFSVHTSTTPITQNQLLQLQKA
jgi:hypothetical protein